MEVNTQEELANENTSPPNPNESESLDFNNHEDSNDFNVEKEIESAMETIDEENNPEAESGKQPASDDTEVSKPQSNGIDGCEDLSEDDGEFEEKDEASEEAAVESTEEKDDETLVNEKSDTEPTRNDEISAEAPSPGNEPSEETAEAEDKDANEGSSQEDFEMVSDSEVKGQSPVHSDKEQTKNMDSVSPTPRKKKRDSLKSGDESSEESPTQKAKKSTPEKQEEDSHKTGEESSEESSRKLPSRTRKKPEKLEYKDASPSPSKKSPTKESDDSGEGRKRKSRRQLTSESESDVPLARTVRTKRGKTESDDESEPSSKTSSPSKRRKDKRKQNSDSENESYVPRKRSNKLTNGGKVDVTSPKFLSAQEALKTSPVVQLGHKVEDTSIPHRNVQKKKTSVAPPKRQIGRPKRNPDNLSAKEYISDCKKDTAIDKLMGYVKTAGLTISDYNSFWAGCKTKGAKVEKLRSFLAEHGIEASDTEDTNDIKEKTEKRNEPITVADQVGFIKIEVLRGQTQSAIHSTLAKVCGEVALPTSQISTIIRSFKKGRLSHGLARKRREVAEVIADLKAASIPLKKGRTLRSGRSFRRKRKPDSSIAPNLTSKIDPTREDVKTKVAAGESNVGSHSSNKSRRRTRWEDSSGESDSESDLSLVNHKKIKEESSANLAEISTGSIRIKKEYTSDKSDSDSDSSFVNLKRMKEKSREMLLAETSIKSERIENDDLSGKSDLESDMSFVNHKTMKKEASEKSYAKTDPYDLSEMENEPEKAFKKAMKETDSDSDEIATGMKLTKTPKKPTVSADDFIVDSASDVNRRMKKKKKSSGKLDSETDSSDLSETENTSTIKKKDLKEIDSDSDGTPAETKKKLKTPARDSVVTSTPELKCKKIKSSGKFDSKANSSNLSETEKKSSKNTKMALEETDTDSDEPLAAIKLTETKRSKAVAKYNKKSNSHGKQNLMANKKKSSVKIGSGNDSCDSFKPAKNLKKSKKETDSDSDETLAEIKLTVTKKKQKVLPRDSSIKSTSSVKRKKINKKKLSVQTDSGSGSSDLSETKQKSIKRSKKALKESDYDSDIPLSEVKLPETKKKQKVLPRDSSVKSTPSVKGKKIDKEKLSVKTDSGSDSSDWSETEQKSIKRSKKALKESDYDSDIPLSEVKLPETKKKPKVMAGNSVGNSSSAVKNKMKNKSDVKMGLKKDSSDLSKTKAKPKSNIKKLEVTDTDSLAKMKHIESNKKSKLLAGDIDKSTPDAKRNRIKKKTSSGKNDSETDSRDLSETEKDSKKNAKKASEESDTDSDKPLLERMAMEESDTVSDKPLIERMAMEESDSDSDKPLLERMAMEESDSDSDKPLLERMVKQRKIIVNTSEKKEKLSSSSSRSSVKNVLEPNKKQLKAEGLDSDSVSEAENKPNKGKKKKLNSPSHKRALLDSDIKGKRSKKSKLLASDSEDEAEEKEKLKVLDSDSESDKESDFDDKLNSSLNDSRTKRKRKRRSDNSLVQSDDSCDEDEKPVDENKKFKRKPSCSPPDQGTPAKAKRIKYQRSPESPVCKNESSTSSARKSFVAPENRPKSPSKASDPKRTPSMSDVEDKVSQLFAGSQSEKNPSSMKAEVEKISEGTVKLTPKKSTVQADSERKHECAEAESVNLKIAKEKCIMADVNRTSDKTSFFSQDDGNQETGEEDSSSVESSVKKGRKSKKGLNFSLQLETSSDETGSDAVGFGASPAFKPKSRMKENRARLSDISEGLKSSPGSNAKTVLASPKKQRILGDALSNQNIQELLHQPFSELDELEESEI